MGTVQPPPYSVIIVLHNSADTLEACLLSIPTRAEVIVVDNASSDEGLTIARRVLPAATLLNRRTNDGFGYACNVGAEHSSSDFLVFLNPDTQIVDGALETLREAWECDTKGAVGPALTSSNAELRTNCR